MFVATAVVKGLTAVGWIALFAVDFHVVRIHLSDLTHGDIRGVLVALSVGIVVRWSRKRRSGGRDYSQGVVDGMRLTSASADLPTPRRSRGGNVLYLHEARNGGACTQRAPKAGAARSSS